MARILIRGLDDSVVAWLAARAAKAGRSVEDEARAVLEQAATLSPKAAQKALADFRKRFGGREFSDSAELIREDRER